MRALALPLRILLALALVLNGIGGAMAGVRIAVPAAVVPLDATHEAAKADGHCGDHAGTAAVELPRPTTGCDSDAEGGDCGDSPECRQACAHAQLAVAAPPSATASRSRAGAILHPLAVGTPAPPLPSPIRPPIA